MDVLDGINRRMSDLFDRYFGAATPASSAASRGRELRPREILRRLFAAMETHRQEGLDGLVYVPNVYTLQIAVEGDAERDYLRTFLGAEELASAMAEHIESQGYGVKGTLLFTVEEQDRPFTSTGERVRIRCRFDPNAASNLEASASQAAPSAPPQVSSVPSAPTVAPAAPVYSPAPSPFAIPDEEDATVPAVRSRTLATLSVTAPGQAPQTVPLTLAGARIGRSRQAGNDIVLDGDGMASKKHARVSYENGRFVVIDESSLNGTLVRGSLIPAGQPVPLQSGDEIVIGQTRLVLRWLEGNDAAPPRPASPTPTMAPPPMPGPKAQTASFRLVAGDGTTYPLASEMTVGRSATEDIMIHGEGVASKHARLSVEGDVVHVVDLNTAGGTYVNGERIPVNFRVSLFTGDQVAFGEVLLHLEQGR